MDVEKIKDTLAHTAVTVGAPVSAGGIGIVSLCEKIAPVLTVISLLTGIILGILSFMLKRRTLMRHSQRHQPKK